MRSISKSKRIVDEAVLEQVRSLPCLACNRRDSDPHHVTTRGSGGGDTLDNLMPLCRIHHTEIHQIGNSRMADKYFAVMNWFIRYERTDLLKRRAL